MRRINTPASAKISPDIAAALRAEYFPAISGLTPPERQEWFKAKCVELGITKKTINAALIAFTWRPTREYSPHAPAPLPGDLNRYSFPIGPSRSNF